MYLFFFFITFVVCLRFFFFFFFFFNDTATTEIYTLSLHDALPISRTRSSGWMSRSWTVQALRCWLLLRWAITAPANAPRAPEGWPNWLRMRLRSLLMGCSDRVAQRRQRAAGADEFLWVEGQVEPGEEAPLTIGDAPDHPAAISGKGDAWGAPVCRVGLGRHQALREQGVDQGLDVLAGDVAAAGDVRNGGRAGLLQQLQHRAHADRDRLGGVQLLGDLGG